MKTQKITLTVGKNGTFIFHQTITENKVIIFEEDYTLKEISRSDVIKLRFKKDPVVILKSYDHYFYSKVNENFKIGSQTSLGPHCCGKLRAICKHLSAHQCPKVRENSKQELMNVLIPEKEAVLKSRRIEKYPWILEGIETVNTISDTIIVRDCKNYSTN